MSIRVNLLPTPPPKRRWFSRRPSDSVTMPVSARSVYGALDRHISLRSVTLAGGCAVLADFAAHKLAHWKEPAASTMIRTASDIATAGDKMGSGVGGLNIALIAAGVYVGVDVLRKIWGYQGPDKTQHAGLVDAQQGAHIGATQLQDRQAQIGEAIAMREAGVAIIHSRDKGATAQELYTELATLQTEARGIRQRSDSYPFQAALDFARTTIPRAMMILSIPGVIRAVSSVPSLEDSTWPQMVHMAGEAKWLVAALGWMAAVQVAKLGHHTWKWIQGREPVLDKLDFALAKVEKSLSWKRWLWGKFGPGALADNRFVTPLLYGLGALAALSVWESIPYFRQGYGLSYALRHGMHNGWNDMLGAVQGTWHFLTSWTGVLTLTGVALATRVARRAIDYMRSERQAAEPWNWWRDTLGAMRMTFPVALAWAGIPAGLQGVWHYFTSHSPTEALGDFRFWIGAGAIAAGNWAYNRIRGVQPRKAPPKAECEPSPRAYY